jgi:hypothetical protein
MFRTITRLYVGTGVLTGSFVYQINMVNMQKAYPPRLSDKTKKGINDVMYPIIIGKSVYYGVLYPVVLVRYAENNMNNIIYLCYGSKIIINDNNFWYVKNRNTNSFQPRTKFRNTSKNGINIEF